MADLVVDGGADAFRIALVVQRSADCPARGRRLIDDLVDLLRANSFMNRRRNGIQHRGIDLGTGLDPGDFCRSANQAVRGNDVAAFFIIRNFLIKRLMAFAIRTAAAAPAWILGFKMNSLHISPSLYKMI